MLDVLGFRMGKGDTAVSDKWVLRVQVRGGLAGPACLLCTFTMGWRCSAGLTSRDLGCMKCSIGKPDSSPQPPVVVEVASEVSVHLVPL